MNRPFVPFRQAQRPMTPQEFAEKNTPPGTVTTYWTRDGFKLWVKDHAGNSADPIVLPTLEAYESFIEGFETTGTTMVGRELFTTLKLVDPDGTIWSIREAGSIDRAYKNRSRGLTSGLRPVKQPVANPLAYRLKVAAGVTEAAPALDADGLPF